jgi:hypothetical protein
MFVSMELVKRIVERDPERQQVNQPDKRGNHRTKETFLVILPKKQSETEREKGKYSHGARYGRQSCQH